MLLLKEGAAVAQTDAPVKPLFLCGPLTWYGDLEFCFSNQIALTVKVNCWKYLCGNFASKNENDKSLNCLWVILVHKRSCVALGLIIVGPGLVVLELCVSQESLVRNLTNSFGLKLTEKNTSWMGYLDLKVLGQWISLTTFSNVPNPKDV